MMRVALLVASGLAVFVAALLALAPASLVARAVDGASEGRLALVATEGTVWNGRGVLSAEGTQIPMQWRVRAGALAHGELEVTLASSTGATLPHGTLRLTRHGVVADDIALEVPGALLPALVDTRPRLDVRGVLSIVAPHLAWRDDATSAGPDGSLAFDWRAAALALAGAPVVPLGDIHGQLAADSGALAGPVSNTGGDVALDGTLRVTRDGGALDLLLTPRRVDDPTLAAMIATLGTPEGFGTRVRRTWRGS